MKIVTSKPNISIDFSGNMTVSFPVLKESNKTVKVFFDKLATLKDKLSVEVKEYRKGRSLNANSYLWVMLNEMGNVLKTGKEEVYFQMLKRYGQGGVVKIPHNMTEMFERAYKYHEKHESLADEEKATYYRFWVGSSEYDTKEMAILIDGVVSECKELGIETMTPQELELLKGEWGK